MQSSKFKKPISFGVQRTILLYKSPNLLFNPLTDNFDPDVWAGFDFHLGILLGLH